MNEQIGLLAGPRSVQEKAKDWADILNAVKESGREDDSGNNVEFAALKRLQELQLKSGIIKH